MNNFVCQFLITVLANGCCFKRRLTHSVEYVDVQCGKNKQAVASEEKDCRN